VARRANSIVPCGPAPAANDTERQQSSSRLDLLIGHLVNGRYRVKRVLARGAMGRVYSATQEPLGRAVALKVVRDDDAGAGELRSHERFLLEADILARLQHPNIVTLFDFGTMEGPFAGQSFIAMELLGGETLSRRLEGRKRLPVADVLTMAVQIARGLRAAHDRGIVHRDLKPSNIILVPDGDGEEIVKLVDFGIGKLLWDDRAEPAPDLTGVGGVVGTPQFMAPEQIGGETLVAADLYALGTIMFLALAGRLPFDEATTTGTLKSKISKVAPRLRDVVPGLDVSDELERLVASLLARAPEDRPTATALTRALTACAERPRPASVAPTALLAPSARVEPPPAALESPTSASLLPAASASAASSRPTPGAVIGAPDDRLRRLARLTPLLVGALLAYAVVLVYVFGRGAPGPKDASATAETTPLKGDTHSGGAESASTGTTFALVVDSVPAGATVLEDGRPLGTTPLVVTVEKKSVASQPRRFALHKNGYVPLTVEQGPSRDDTRMVVALAHGGPLVAAPRAPAPTPPAATSSAPPAVSTAPAPTAPPTASVQVFSTGQ
jgi:serine/threonine-protein kinase